MNKLLIDGLFFVGAITFVAAPAVTQPVEVASPIVTPEPLPSLEPAPPEPEASITATCGYIVVNAGEPSSIVIDVSPEGVVLPEADQFFVADSIEADGILELTFPAVPGVWVYGWSYTTNDFSEVADGRSTIECKEDK